jgi:ParB family chromosome partitioning protein
MAKSTAAKIMEDTVSSGIEVAGKNPMEERVFEIPLEQIRPAPWNPPARMDPKTIQELGDSIALHGQQIPALLRPIGVDACNGYELVFGHRRFAALQLLLNNSRTLQPEGVKQPFPLGGAEPALKAFVRSMSEEEAMILSGIENLQRQGFSDIEEAEFFRAAGERYGESAVKILAEKLSVSDRYIRKRVEILKLPEAALQLWRDGTWHAGHMEQLLRIGTPEDVQAYLEETKKSKYDWDRLLRSQVFELRERINHLSIPLSHGRFDKSECKVCRKNTAVQLTLFGGEKDKTACLDQKCFATKQQAWLDINWKGCKANKFGTNAAILGSYHSNKHTGNLNPSSGGAAPGEQCKSCQQYISFVDMEADVPPNYNAQYCVGDKACYAAVLAAGKKAKKSVSASSSSEASDAPRVEWHGEHFRQQFYAEQVPELLDGLLTQDPRRLQLALATIIHGVPRLHGWFCGKLNIDPKKYQRFSDHTQISFPHIIALVKPLKPLQVEYLMAEASMKAAFEGAGRNYEIQFDDWAREAIAEFLGIDFAKFIVSDEWLQKKTKSELVRYIAQESGLRLEAPFQEYLGRYKLTLEKLAGLKKPDLIQIILNSGVDLHGRLPAEIANKPNDGGER